MLNVEDHFCSQYQKRLPIWSEKNEVEPNSFFHPLWQKNTDFLAFFEGFELCYTDGVLRDGNGERLERVTKNITVIGLKKP
jgi:hypothetical protein